MHTLVPLTLLTAALAGAEGEPAGLEIGQRAPDFDLPGVDGKRHVLGDFAAAQVLAVVFTCNHCPTAQAYEGRLKALAADFKDRGAALVAISPNDPLAVRLDELGYTDLGDSLEDMKLRAQAEGFNFPYLYDGETQKVSRAYGPRATPHVFVFDRERKLRYSGRIDDRESGKEVKSHDTRTAIEALLAGKPPPVERTRSFGCSIKWSDKRSDNERFLKRLAGEKASLEKIDAAAVRKLRENKTDKVLLINVWATWCGPCKTEFPDLVTIHRMYRGRPFELVTISVDLPKQSQEVLPFLEKQICSARNLLYDSEDRDALAEALDRSWSGALPFTLLIKPQGGVAYRKEGPYDPLELRRAVVKEIGRTYGDPR